MGEIVAESSTCSECGADIRDGSQFCYNCGHTITEVPNLELTEANPVDPGEVENGAISETPSAEPRKLRTAASLRKRTKAFNRQMPEYVWKRRTGPTVGFVIAVIVLTVFTGILLFLAMYLR